MNTLHALKRWPELGAGGFTRNDGTVAFYTRVQALLQSSGVVLDFGAGRGARDDDPVSYRRALSHLRGPGRTVIGVDVDPAVAQNTMIDDYHILKGDELPIADSAVDLIIADMVFEHIQRPNAIARELHRVLAPGGWICARTPNKYGYIAIGARVIPNSAHASLLATLQPNRRSEDIFPTVYALNTHRALKRSFPPSCFVHHCYAHRSDPGYLKASPVATVALSLLTYLTPEPLLPMLMVFLQKR